MKKTSRMFLLVALLAAGCSTTAEFRLPAGTKVDIPGRPALKQEGATLTTRPFFWNAAGGIKFNLLDSSGKIVKSGKLPSAFRVASIFWPPYAIIYWPMGMKRCYDLLGDAPQLCEPKK